MPARIVYATFPSVAAAEEMARALVEARLVACANILPEMVSIYRWEGQIERGTEAVMMLKTTAERAAEVVEAVRAAHPYDVPAIVVLPLEGGLPAYLAWIAGEVAAG